MSEKTAHPLNCEGPFYVENECCLKCDLPRTVAPDMFRFTEKIDHCYVYQQPQTNEQLKRMIEVVRCAELACVRCRSRDPEILRLLRKEGLKEQCDYPLVGPNEQSDCAKKGLLRRIGEIFWRSKQ